MAGGCVVILATMKWHEFIESESAMNTGSDCVLATQKNELGWAITPPMAPSLMAGSVAGSAGKHVRKRERSEGTNCGREKPEVGMTPTPPRSGHATAGRPRAGLLAAARRGCSTENRKASQTLSVQSSNRRRQENERN
jgi:hypothetical protein